MYKVIGINEGKFTLMSTKTFNIEDARKYVKTVSPDRDPKIIPDGMEERAIVLNNQRINT